MPESRQQFMIINVEIKRAKVEAKNVASGALSRESGAHCPRRRRGSCMRPSPALLAAD